MSCEHDAETCLQRGGGVHLYMAAREGRLPLHRACRSGEAAAQTGPV